MARQLRQDPPGGWHHITNRGARRYDTFIDDEDRASFLDYVIKACDRFGARLVSYCLMANHYHLVMHCPDGQVSSIVNRSIEPPRIRYARLSPTPVMYKR